MDDRFADQPRRTATAVASIAIATTTIKSKAKPIAIDLFCGVGGMSLGFKEAGFDIRAAIDVDPINVEMHEKNFPSTKAIQADLSSIKGVEIRERAALAGTKIDVVFGGPPCQGFSLIGKRDLKDPRSALLKHFVRITSELDADYFVIENVAGLISGSTSKILDEALAYADSVGYCIVRPIQVLNAADFGVPQNRKRVFILGVRKGLPIPSYPKNLGLTPPTVWDAIGDLSKIRGKEYFESDVYVGTLEPTSEYALSLARKGSRKRLTGCLRSIHTAKTILRFKTTEPGTQEKVSRFFRLSKTGLSNTLRAGSGRSHGSYTAPRPIHPIEPRCITVREAARLHSFPDWFEFHPTRWHGFRQVGNSVPPRLAKSVAQSLLKNI